MENIKALENLPAPFDNPLVHRPYDRDSVEERVFNKLWMQEMHGLIVSEDVPVFGCVTGAVSGRTAQKLMDSLPEHLAQGAQLVLTGALSPEAEEPLSRLKKQFPRQVSVRPYSAANAAEIFSSADLFLPVEGEESVCKQAMRYGMVPVEEEISKSLALYRELEAWEAVQKRCMEHPEIVTVQLAYDSAAELRTLFGEYTNMLLEHDPSFASYLELQNYNAELAHLEEKYGLPEGRLYLARVDGAAAGCIGLRKLDSSRCEMKRLYVRPAYRGHHLARQLVQTVLADAKSIGYTEMLLDTLPFLQNAIRLYERFGFQETEAYNDSPVAATVFMKLKL